MSDRAAFTKAIQENPLDHLTRMAYADWLEEFTEEYEEATRQRQWVAAYDHLKLYTNVNESHFDEDGRPTTPVAADEVYQGVTAEINYWVEAVKGGESPCFRTNYAQDELRAPDNKKEFWRQFQILTGVTPSEEIQEEEWYRCAC